MADPSQSNSASPWPPPPPVAARAVALVSGQVIRRGRGFMDTVRLMGTTAIWVEAELGRIAIFGALVLRALLTPPFRFRALVKELHNLGVLSLAIICICGLAVGMVLGLQGYRTLARFGASSSEGAMVGLSLIKELGPVITALLVTGRAGSSTAAEIGAMVVTEQLDGLRMMAIDPIHMIVAPKCLGMSLAVPFLTAMFILCGIAGGYLVGVDLMGVYSGAYMSSLRSNTTFRDDVASSIVKSAAFGMLIGLIATYRGYTCQRTAEGVSSATTNTVVIGSVCILLVDYIITALWGA